MTLIFKSFSNSMKINAKPGFRSLILNSCLTADDRSWGIKEAPSIDGKQELMKENKITQKKGYITVYQTELLSPITGIPEEHVKFRRVKISTNPKNPMQSGTDNVGYWTMEFETKEKWENPLMGWASSGDPLSNMNIQFLSKDDAISFCEKNGWEWFVEEGKQKHCRVKSYGFNFSWDKRTRVSTK